MTNLRDGILIAACMVAGLAFLAAHNHFHPGFGPMGWTNAGTRSVSIGFMAQLIGLQVRRVASAVGTAVTIR
jgi:hypothetical protein